MNKIIYLLDPASGALLGESIHPLDPVETALANKPVHAQLNPLHATVIAPPNVPKGRRAIYAHGGWTLQDIPVPLPDTPVPEIPPPVANPPTLEERALVLRSHVQQYMDAMARSLGYDDIRTAVTYADEPAVPKFQNEGKALRAWRSLVWAACDELLAAVEADSGQPTASELIALLPKLEVPPLESPAAVES